MKRPDIEKLTKLMDTLRSPGGCPWDREQTLKSLVPFIIEEAYEVVSAIDSGSPEQLREELGDLLFQVVFASRLASEKKEFTMAEVINECHEKMIRRHPHVFADTRAETAEEVLRNWAEIKKAEKKGAGKKGGVLEGVPETLPALMRAHKISQKASKAGFDWKDAEHCLTKVDEELGELKEAISEKDRPGMEEELGDLLFTVVNVSRFIDVNPEDALRKTIGKFIRRFHDVEKNIETSGREPAAVSMDEMERLWEEAKMRDKKGS